MLLALELSLKEKIEKQYEEWMACCPNKKSEIDAWIKSADEDEAVCMKYLYAYMHPCDIVSYDVEVIASYGDSSYTYSTEYYSKSDILHHSPIMERFWYGMMKTGTKEIPVVRFMICHRSQKILR